MTLKRILWLIFFLLFLFLTITFFYKITGNKPSAEISKNLIQQKDTIKKTEPDSLIIARLDSANQSAEAISKTMSGRKITVLITGVDARLGSGSIHADANHLLNIWLDSGKIEIMSIPRGSFVDIGLSDSLHLNYLANVRSLRGRERYQEAVRLIAHVDTINYWIEFGFSQAIGLMELLGYKENSVQMLRVLRSRKAFGIGDYQRAYNQGQFIRQMILSRFSNTDNLLGDVIIRTGLMLVENNMNYLTIKNIVNSLKEKKFPKSSGDVFVRLVPPYKEHLLDYNFTNDKSIDSLYKRIARSALADTEVTDDKLYKSDFISKRIFNQLHFMAMNAKKIQDKNPEQAIKNLSLAFKQKSWYQITARKLRDSVKSEIYSVLIKSYLKTNQKDKAEYILRIIDTEKENERRSKK